MLRSSVRAALAACVLLALAWSAAAKTTRTATVDVVNNSGQRILPMSINVMHKYSDVFKNGYVYRDALEVGQRTNPTRWIRTRQDPAADDTGGSAVVQYNTGFGTTGVDWWSFTWTSAPDYVLHTSDPDNGRKFFDLAEKAGPKIVAVVTTAAVIAASEGAATPAAEKAGVAASLLVGATLLNGEATDGFKRCFLTSDDENRPVVIDLTGPASLTIRPASSSSCDTVSTNTKLDPAAFKPAAPPAPPTGPPRPVTIEYRNLRTLSLLDVALEAVQGGRSQTNVLGNTPLVTPSDGAQYMSASTSPLQLGSGPVNLFVAFTTNATQAFATNAGPGVCAIAAPGLAGAVTARMNDVAKKMSAVGPMVNCGFPAAADCKSIADPKWPALRGVGIYTALDTAGDGCGTFACTLAPGDDKLVVKIYDKDVKVEAYPSKTKCPTIGLSELVAGP